MDIKNTTQEELDAIIAKFNNGSMTKEEYLVLLKEINRRLDSFNMEIDEVLANK